MKIQMSVIKYNLKKTYKWFIILFILLFICIITYSIKSNKTVVDIFDYNSIILYSHKTLNNLFYILMLIYQIFLTILISYMVYTYEINYCLENILLRVKAKNFLSCKIISLVIFIALYRFCFGCIVYIFFHNIISYPILSILNNICLHIIISLIVITCINFIKRKCITMMVFIMIILLPLLYISNYIIAIIVIISLLLINYYFFSLKKILNNK